jgi:hypothetical protein
MDFKKNFCVVLNAQTKFPVGKRIFRQENAPECWRFLRLGGDAAAGPGSVKGRKESIAR